jgi:16S rRNA processing protein RimM
MPPRLARIARSSSRSSKRSEPTTAAAAGTVAVGEIVSAHALRGLVRVRPYQPPAPSLAAGRQVVLEQDGARRTVTLVSVAAHGRALLLVALRDIDDRNAAEALIGARLLVRAEDLPPPAPDEFYYHEVEGFRVETTDGTYLGTVDETFSTGLNDVLVVRNADREHLIPVITDVIRTVDRDQRRIVIEPMPGLLE